MTPQSNFMILAPVRPEREAELRALLDSMNEAPGRVNPQNPLIPFAQFDRLHFARLLLLDDRTTEDVRVYGLAPRAYPLYFTFLGDIDGAENDFLETLARIGPEGLRKIFSCCAGFSASADLVAWMKRHRAPPVAAYVNWRGRTVRQIREEAALHAALEQHIESDPAAFAESAPIEVHSRLRDFVQREKSSGRLQLSPEERTPLGWRIRNLIHLVALPLLVLIFLPLLIVATPFYLVALRRREKSDPVVCPTVDQAHSENLSRLEDHYVTNQFSAMGSLKPNLLRRLTTIGVLSTVDYGARHLIRNGRLGRIRSIHFARWVFIAGKERMAFFSNYDGSVESYMDDFINKTGFGLNASFSNGIGYPRTNWLVLDGCTDERNYKEYLRRHTLATQVWYKAYPALTAVDLERNTRLRRALESRSLSPEEAREWVALL